MTEKEPTGGWDFASAYNLLTKLQKQEYDFRRKNFDETAEETLTFVRKWIK